MLTSGKVLATQLSAICKCAFYFLQMLSSSLRKQPSFFAPGRVAWLFQSKHFENRAKSCKILRKRYFGIFGEICAWLYEKDRSLENIAHFMSKRVGKRVCDMIQSPSFWLRFHTRAARSRVKLAGSLHIATVRTTIFAFFFRGPLFWLLRKTPFWSAVGSTDSRLAFII